MTNKNWKLYDKNGKTVFTNEKDILAAEKKGIIAKGEGITKAQFAKQGGNGYVISKHDPSIRIPVKNGFPQYGEITEVIAKLESKVTTNRDVNFERFDRAIAREWRNNNGIIPQEYADALTRNHVNFEEIKFSDIKILRRQLKLVWHEAEDGFTGYLVPRVLHNAASGGIPHLGGVSVTHNYAQLQDIMNIIRSGN